MQRRGQSGQPTKVRRGGPKARKAPTAHSSIEQSTEQFDRLKRERDEALEQLAATSQVLRIISSSSGDLESVFHAILDNATRICRANFGVLWRRSTTAPPRSSRAWAYLRRSQSIYNGGLIYPARSARSIVSLKLASASTLPTIVQINAILNTILWRLPGLNSAASGHCSGCRCSSGASW